MARPRPDRKSASPWLLFLFALPFAGVGIGFLLLSVLPSLYQWQQMQSWQPVSAQLLQAELKTHRGDDSNTYQALARYRYHWQGQTHTGERVGIMSGADNVGDWQQRRAGELGRAHRQGLPVTVYVDPAEPGQSVVFRELRWGLLGFKMIFVLVFGGVGVGLMVFVWRGRRKSALQSPGLAPWQQVPDWANPVVSASRAGLWGVGLFALFWNAISLPLVFALPAEIAKGNTLALVGYLFPLIGAAILVLFVIKLARWRRFGAAPFTLDPWPGSIGGQLAGHLDLRLPWQQDLLVRAELCCLHSYYTGSGKSRKQVQSLVWQKAGIASLAPLQRGCRVSVCFDIPAGLPESEPVGNDYHHWRLRLSAPLAGADLDLSYELPVFATAQPANARYALSDQHPALAGERDLALEQLLNLRQLPGGIELWHRQFRHWRGNSAGALFGAVFFAIGWYLGDTDAPAIMAWVFMLMGGGFVLACLYSLLNSYRVKLGSRGIYTERRLLGLLLKKRRVAPEQVRQLVIVRRGSSQLGSRHVEHFAIQAELAGGAKVTVAESLDGRGLAEQALEALSMLSGFPAAPRH